MVGSDRHFISLSSNVKGFLPSNCTVSLTRASDRALVVRTTQSSDLFRDVYEEAYPFLYNLLANKYLSRNKLANENM